MGKFDICLSHPCSASAVRLLAARWLSGTTQGTLPQVASRQSCILWALVSSQGTVLSFILGNARLTMTSRSKCSKATLKRTPSAQPATTSFIIIKEVGGEASMTSVLAADFYAVFFPMAGYESEACPILTHIQGLESAGATCFCVARKGQTWPDPIL